MSQSVFLPVSIPIANPNRLPPERRTPLHSFTCFGYSNKTPSPDSATNATASAGKLYSSISANPPISLLQHWTSPELGLVSVLFVLSTVFGAFVSLGLISIPAMAALRRLEMSARRLEKVVAREVPGTLLSLKLSSMEIGRVTQLLSSIRLFDALFLIMEDGFYLETRVEVEALRLIESRQYKLWIIRDRLQKVHFRTHLGYFRWHSILSSRLQVVLACLFVCACQVGCFLAC